MRNLSRKYRHKRILRKIKGSTDRVRLVVFRSHKHIYAQLIDDKSREVVTGASTLSAQFKEKKIKSSTQEAAKEVGRIIARAALEKKISLIWFDRGGYLFHGRVKSLAEGAREGGLKF